MAAMDACDGYPWMNIGEYHCDIASVLQNGDFSIVQTLSAFCRKFETHIASKIPSATTCESANTEREEPNVNKMSELQEEVENLKLQINEVKLQQKILDKKILNIIQQEEQLKNDIIDAQACRDALALELVDLRQEVQERREKKLKIWDAIKRATNVYKFNLDFVIYIEKKEDFDVVKVSFFRDNLNIRDKYYVRLVNEDKLWKVKEIHPMLRTEHWTHLKDTVDFTRQSEISNVTAFLCLLRSVFTEYYMDSS